MGYEEAEIKSLVRQIVTRTLGDTALAQSTASRSVGRTIIDEEAVRQMPVGSLQQLPEKTIVTPLARQIALERRIRFEMIGGGSNPGSPNNPQVASQPHITKSKESNKKSVAIGADHGGYELKEVLKSMLAADGVGYHVVDCGTYSTDSVDYPDYAFAVARMVASGSAWRGIIIDGAGIGSCMVANKVPGVRAAMCYDQATAVNSREHNNANVLTLGAGLIGTNLAKQIVQTWLSTEFAGGRHARRVDKIDRIGQRYAK